MPSLFSVNSPATAFQWWFDVYLYVLPFMLYASWAALSLLDLRSELDRAFLDFEAQLGDPEYRSRQHASERQIQVPQPNGRQIQEEPLLHRLYLAEPIGQVLGAPDCEAARH